MINKYNVFDAPKNKVRMSLLFRDLFENSRYETSDLLGLRRFF